MNSHASGLPMVQSQQNRWRSNLRQAVILTVASLKTRYRNTVSGLVWVILNPLLVFGAQAFVFYKILHINVDNYPLFLLSGLLPWIFLVSSVEMGTGAFTQSGKLLKSFPVHPFVILSSQILDNLFNFLLSFTVILIPTAIAFHFDWPRYFLVPLSIAPLFIFVMAFVFTLATIQVFFWDTRFVMSFAMSVAFYMTPIIYPIEFIDINSRWLVNLNPFWQVLHPFQIAISGDLHFYATSLANSFLAAALMSGVAFINWGRSKNEFYFYI